MGTPEQITPQTVAGLPDQPLEEGVNGLPELSAYVAIKARTKPTPERTIHRQTELAKSIMAQLRSLGMDEDADLVADTLEGETNLTEAIAAALAEIDEGEILITGLKAKRSDFETRQKLIEDRNERLRAIIEQAMLATEQMTLRLPTATLSLSKRKRGLVVISEAEIPSRFWIEQERPAPKLDKKALASAIEAGDSVAGAELDNGSFSLSVRRK